MSRHVTDRGAKAAPTLKIREMPEDERPREKLIAHGAAALNDPELIAILLRTGVPGANAIEVARELLNEVRFTRRIESLHRKGNRRDSRHRSGQGGATRRRFRSRSTTRARVVRAKENRFARIGLRSGRARKCACCTRNRCA